MNIQYLRLLISGAVITEKEVDAMEKEFQRELEKAIDFTGKSPYPDIGALYENVYVDEG